MSGHSGFQAIGASLPPSVPPPTVTGTGGSSALSPAAGASAPPAPAANEPNAVPSTEQHVPPQELLQKLDTLLLTAAKYSTKAVDTKTLASWTDKTHLDLQTRAQLDNAARHAQETFAALSQFSGRQIASALSVDEKGRFDWKNGDPVAAALKEAIDAQADLSLHLHKLVNDPRISHKLFDALCELAMQADRRQSEIFSLALQLADAAGQAGTDPVVAARLDAKLEDLLPRQALSMHGTDSAIQRLKDKLQPLADRLQAFAAKPNASIASEEFFAYNFAVDEAVNALGHAAANGFPDGKGGRWEPDKTLFYTAKKLVDFAKSTLSDVRTQVGLRSVQRFVNSTIRLPDDLAIVQEENLPGIEQDAPTLTKAAGLRHQIYKLSKQYMANPSSELATELHRACFEMMKINRNTLKKEIDTLAQANSGGTGMKEKDWDELREQFDRPKGMMTQVAHLFLMMDKTTGMHAEKFLSTSSARALVEGRLDFSTLVESRIHGMRDEDVNPALGDSHFVSSTTLGSGAANTVYLVTYDDGSEYVFKPEAAGRQGMAELTYSRDYMPWQQVVQLNLATQATADSLGLDDIMSKSTTGCHKKQFGLFMEKAPGMTGRNFAKDDNGPPGHLTAAQVRSLPAKQYGQVVGQIIRQTNRLEWFDLLTGQGDRHRGNYMVDVTPGGTVTFKCIDNDESFPAYRTGLQKYTLTKSDANFFNKKVDEFIERYPAEYRAEVRARIEAEKAITRLPNDGIVVDASKFKSPELFYALHKTIGIQTSVLPDFIDADLYDRLMRLKAGDDRDKYIANLSSRLPKEAVNSAIARLDEAIDHAEKLNELKMVIQPQDFARRDVQNRLFAKTLQQGPNPFQATEDGRFRLTLSDEVTKLAAHSTRPVFIRDLFSAIEKPGWFI